MATGLGRAAVRGGGVGGGRGRRPGRAPAITVDAPSRRFEPLEDVVELVRLDHELLKALHGDLGHFGGRVAVEELRDAALGGREELEARLEVRIVADLAVLVDRAAGRTPR